MDTETRLQAKADKLDRIYRITGLSLCALSATIVATFIYHLSHLI